MSDQIDIFGLAPGEEERVNVKATGQRAAWVPFANHITPEMPTRGTYPLGYPQGAIVHYTAGHQTQKGENAINNGRANGYAYFFIDHHGGIFQGHPLTHWGYHAGKSFYPGLGSGVSQKLVGIEIASAGKLDKTDRHDVFKTWWGQNLYNSVIDYRYCAQDKDNIKAGAYQRYTSAQEMALITLLLWLKGNCPEIFNLDFVLGHDEVAPGRKTDPGGSLSMTMPEFRALIKKRYLE